MVILGYTVTLSKIICRYWGWSNHMSFSAVVYCSLPFSCSRGETSLRFLKGPIWSPRNRVKFQDSNRERWTWICSLLASLPGSTAMTAGWGRLWIDDCKEKHEKSIEKCHGQHMDPVFPYWEMVMDPVMFVWISIAMMSPDVWIPLIGWMAPMNEYHLTWPWHVSVVHPYISLG